VTDEEPLVPGIDANAGWMAGIGGVPAARPVYALAAAAVKTGG
jgi:hypothetical protein